MELPPAARAPAPDEEGSSVQNYERQVRLWMRAATTDPASKVCLSAGGDPLDDQDGVARILEMLRRNFAPGVADAAYQQVARLFQYRRADQSIDEFIAEFDLLRGKAESMMEMAAGFPEQMASIPRMHNAGLLVQN